MGIQYHDVLQGSEEWANLRIGLITASEMGLLMTPKTLKSAANDKMRKHLWELLAQRITKYVEPRFYGDDMARGHEDEVDARNLYSQNFSPVEQVGIITNDKWGFTLGYSPDGLIENRTAGIECKSRLQRYQIQTIIEWAESQKAPEEYLLQCQTGMLVGELNYLDLISYSGGLPMRTMSIWPDDKIHNAIVEVTGEVEAELKRRLDLYHDVVANDPLLIPTERREAQEIF